MKGILSIIILLVLIIPSYLGCKANSYTKLTSKRSEGMNHVPFKGEKNIDSLLKFDIIYFGDLRLDLRSIEKDRQEIFVSIINPILISHTLLGAKSLVCCLEELDSSETKKKQFRFWVYSSRIVNPTEFVVELTNPNAGSDVSMSEFLENAEVTYLSKGNIII